MKKEILVFGLLILFTCCKQTDKKVLSESNDRIKDTIYFDNGAILGIVELTKDSIPDGLMIKYFPNGNVNFKRNFKLGKLTGLSTHYYDNGKIREVSIYKDDTLNGEFLEYYISGNLKFRHKYHEGKLVGTSLEYFDTEDRKLKCSSRFTIVGNISYLMTYTKYNEDGSILETQSYLNISEDNNEIIIELKHPEFETAIAVIGKYDMFFNLNDSLSIDSISFDKNFITKIPYQKGDTIRGFVTNFEWLDKSKTIERHLFFAYPDVW